MITQDFKQKIVKAIMADATNYPSAAKQARALDISSAQLSRIKKGMLDKVISDAKWISLARRLNVTAGNEPEWRIAKTPAFEYISTQLDFCQANSVSAVLCDLPDIGKTFTAKYYCRTHKNAVYVDCSQVKSKQKLIRKIAKEFGVDNTGRYADVYADLVFYLRSLPNPLIVLDEAGDLDYPAFLELKALWNATEQSASYYMMGADGLRVKIERGKDRKKVGYAEIFSRFGDGFKRITPPGRDDMISWKKHQMALVAKANGLKLPTPKLYAKTGGSLRRVYIEYKKQVNATA
jgi:DNA transposition AAA+ family ATPase